MAGSASRRIAFLCGAGPGATSYRRSTTALSLVAGVSVLSVPARAATTIEVTPTIWSFFDPSFGNNFRPTPFSPGQTHLGTVGRSRPSVNYPTNGDYAATFEFAIPTLPNNAVVANLSLTFTGFVGGRLGIAQLRTYAAETTAPDVTRLYNGNVLTNAYRQPMDVVTTDLTGTITQSLFEANSGLYLGFSLREVAPLCTSIPCDTFTIFGKSDAPDAYTLPVLSVTYDISVPPPPVEPSAVPEPAAWTMMILGFGMVGGAMRRRREATVRGGRAFGSDFTALGRAI